MNSYEEIWKIARQEITSLAVDVAWNQWSAIGSMAASRGSRHTRRVVDPEALILLSLAFGNEERRLPEMVRWWARVGTPLTSVNRMKSVVAAFGGRSTEYLSSFAALAVDEGHRNWNRYTQTTSGAKRKSHPDSPSELRLSTPATLLIRMRAAFGVNAKSDVLAFLIGSRDTSSTVATISRAVGYTKTAVRQSLKEIVVAHLVSETSTHPAIYSTNYRAWLELLELGNDDTTKAPYWCLWVPLFGFLAKARDMASNALTEQTNAHVMASMARDAVENFEYGFAYHDIPTPSPSKHLGLDYVHAFLGVVRSLAEWMRKEK